MIMERILWFLELRSSISKYYLNFFNLIKEEHSELFIVTIEIQYIVISWFSWFFRNLVEAKVAKYDFIS